MPFCYGWLGAGQRRAAAARYPGGVAGRRHRERRTAPSGAAEPQRPAGSAARSGEPQLAVATVFRFRPDTAVLVLLLCCGRVAVQAWYST